MTRGRASGPERRSPARGIPRPSAVTSRWTALALTLLLGACSSFGIGSSEPKPVEANVFPANFKDSLVSFLQLNPYGLVGTREASLSAPELKAFGSESRYVSCLRAVGPDWRKEKMIVYYGGTINQFIDATGDVCAAAAYQPFPELPTLLARIKSGK